MALIHDLTLPENTRELLLGLTRLLVDLLDYAAQEREAIDKERCVAYLNEYATHSLGAHKEVVDAIWEASSRVDLLKAFHTTFHDQKSNRAYQVYKAPEARVAWLLRVRCEIEELAKPSRPLLEIYYFYGDGEKLIKKDDAPSWQQHAGEFFLHFYGEYLEGDRPFPRGFFPEVPESFSRQTFLNAFQDKNQSLTVCPTCDEGRYYSRSAEKIYTTLDHYLPKHLYPHFACHPCNLVPLCHICNVSIKRDEDPLIRQTEGPGPGKLSRAALPYAQHFKRRESFYLEVRLGRNAEQIRIGDLQPHRSYAGESEQELRMALATLQRIYHIPERWADKQQERKEVSIDNVPVDSLQEWGRPAYRVSEALFRRMRHFLGQGRDIAPASGMKEVVYNSLKLLLYYLDVDDRGRDPFAVAMLWILATLLKEEENLQRQIDQLREANELDTAKRLQPPLLDEVLSWCGQDKDKIDERESRATALLSFLDDQ